ncbi:type II CRISPR RNA-guided endonuclease Cas9 [Methyloglobulus sp.]|uniref:type II CRISPR RNA-guided endonuclease Cas9 n=1 Tax=Methyloglobulus sp. TaxID=2518622 RepID=UPI00398A1761
MGKKILGLDLGTNSIGWALLEETDSKSNKIINLGSRIFIKAVEEKTPTPKNVKRRNARLTRRVLQRRARRKLRMLNYLITLKLLPQELTANPTPEIILNELGNPYQLRARALDNPLAPFELGRVFLHLVQRRGFLSNRKTLLGDMADDPDVLAELESEDDNSKLKNTITESGFRTLGEYLASLSHHDCKRNRKTDGGHLRTDRQMYRDELDLIWQHQKHHHNVLTDAVKEQIEDIIFYQRPLKLRADRVGKCSLEPAKNRAKIAWLESQRFRYLQDINNLQYVDPYTNKTVSLNEKDKQKLVKLFENTQNVSFAAIRKTLGLDKSYEFNLEIGTKKLKGNITGCEIRKRLPEWDGFDDTRQRALVEDLLTITKKSVLKNRLLKHWGFDVNTSVQLCLLEFEPGHGNLSLKAINKLLPFLQQGQIYSDARVSAGYGYEVKDIAPTDRLGIPPELPNPIVQKALHELRRLINAIIAEYGKPDAIRVEMARDLEMNTTRYQDFIKQQGKNTKANDEATSEYQEMGQQYPHLKLSKYPSKTDKIKYRLWQDQKQLCAYSCKTINLSELFTANIEVDHILPYSESLDDSYMNKVICYAAENRNKGQRTPVDAFSGNADKWNQITQAINRWDRSLKAKKARFFTTSAELQKRDFINSQLNDTRYISRVAQTYLAQLGADISVSKGITTAWLRHQWGLNDLIGETDKKERTDHRHHAIDAVVIACVDRRLYQTLVKTAQDLERRQSELNMKDIHIDPPWLDLREDLQQRLADIIIAHAPQLKLSGALHEDTGSGFVEGKGTVYRKGLSDYFDKCTDEKKAAKLLKKVIDPSVATIIKEHLSIYQFNAKSAFADSVIVKHKDGKTAIKRIRVYGSMQITNSEDIEKEKFAVKNQRGEIFKWYTYGNIHHIEIIKDINTSQFSGVFVTMMEAHRRAMTGTKSAINRKVIREPIIKKQHDGDYVFAMSLHKKDMVSLEINGVMALYQVQGLGQLSQGKQPRPELIPHTCASEKTGAISDSIKNLIEKYHMKIHKVNANGKLVE